jgi:hypothetical protein
VYRQEQRGPPRSRAAAAVFCRRRRCCEAPGHRRSSCCSQTAPSLRPSQVRQRGDRRARVIWQQSCDAVCRRVARRRLQPPPTNHLTTPSARRRTASHQQHAITPIPPPHRRRPSRRATTPRAILPVDAPAKYEETITRSQARSVLGAWVVVCCGGGRLLHLCVLRQQGRGSAVPSPHPTHPNQPNPTPTPTPYLTAVILGGGAGTRLYPLTKARAKAAVPIAGAYRLIDIPMSNCLNSGISKVYVLTQVRGPMDE